MPNMPSHYTTVPASPDEAALVRRLAEVKMTSLTDIPHWVRQPEKLRAAARTVDGWAGVLEALADGALLVSDTLIEEVQDEASFYALELIDPDNDWSEDPDMPRRLAEQYAAIGRRLRGARSDIIMAARATAAAS